MNRVDTRTGVSRGIRRRFVTLFALGLGAGAVSCAVPAPPRAQAADPVPTITTVAGDGRGIGCSGDGGPATDASMNTPQAVAVAPNGNLYIADAGNNVIRMVPASSGTYFGQQMVAGDIYTVVGRARSSSTTCSAPGYAGDGGSAAEAQLDEPTGLAIAGDGSLFIADTNNYAIRMVPAESGTMFGRPMIAGDIYTVAGDGIRGYTGDGGPATAAQLGLSETIAIDADDSLYIADFTCNCIRKVTPDGTISTFASGLDAPLGVGFDAAGTLYVCAFGGNQILRIAPDGSITAYAGSGAAGYAGDGGAATAAELDRPHGLAVGTDGSVYLSDRGNSRIRVISPQGIISTYAGNGTAGFSGDGGPALDAEINYAEAVAISPHGDLYIADALNDRVREISAPAPGG